MSMTAARAQRPEAVPESITQRQPANDPRVQQVVQISPAPYVTIPLAAACTGLTVKAITRKIESGKWLEGKEYRRSPDGGIFISMEGYTKWVEKGRA
jgi:hypothetical protein